MQYDLDISQIASAIRTARKLQPADIVIKDAQVVNLFTKEIHTADVAVSGKIIAGVGNYSGVIEIDAAGRFLAPGLIDSHLHLESSLLSPVEFAKAVIPHGTTAVVIDPHEIANVAGVDGVEDILSTSSELPITFYVMVPSCVPASGLETSGAVITAEDIARLYRYPQVLGLAEVMDFVGVLNADPDVIKRIAVSRDKIIDGHAPGLTGDDLQAYCAAGMGSDHETISIEEGLQKLQAGMYLMLRHGSVPRNLNDLVGLVNENTSARCLLVTDDLLPTDIEHYGHIDHLLRMLVDNGVDPVTAVRMASFNAAQRLGLRRSGAIAPGYQADMVLFDNLTEFQVSLVISSGRVVAKDGEMTVDLPSKKFSDRLTDSVHIGAFGPESLAIAAQNGNCRVIVAEDGRITTKSLVTPPAVLSGRVVADTNRDILKIAVVERHKATGNVGVGLIHGFGLKAGALASSVAHDAHNIVVTGTSDTDMVVAVREVEKLRGGLVVVNKGKVMASLPLPIGGLISDVPFQEIYFRLNQLEKAAGELGTRMVHPFMTLSFMALEVIPELKLTDRGLVDAAKGRFVDLFEPEAARAASG